MLSSFLIFILFTLQHIFSESCPPAENVTPCQCLKSGSVMTVRCSHLESLRELEDSVHALKGLKLFSFLIKDSTFEYIPNNLFENVTIRELEVSQSTFARIGNLGQPQFKGLENSLETLRFVKSFSRKNPFANVVMENLNRLTTLEVRDGYVGVVYNHCFKKGPKSLQVIRFVKGGIRAVGYDAFNTLTNSRIIDLSDNELTYIPRTALPEPAPYLEELNLERNKFDSLTEDMFSDMPNLKIVNLELNEISTIDEAVWKPVWKHLLSLNIDYNPMICNKKIKWIYDSNHDLENKLTATCYKPFKLMDRDLHSLKPEEIE